MNQPIPSPLWSCTSPFPKGMILSQCYAGSMRQGKDWPMRYSWSGLWTCYAPRRTGGGCGVQSQQQPHYHPRHSRTTHPRYHTMLPMPIPGPRTPPLPRICMPLLPKSCPWTSSAHMPNLWRTWSCGHQLPNCNHSPLAISPSPNG